MRILRLRTRCGRRRCAALKEAIESGLGDEDEKEAAPRRRAPGCRNRAGARSPASPLRRDWRIGRLHHFQADHIVVKDTPGESRCRVAEASRRDREREGAAPGRVRLDESARRQKARRRSSARTRPSSTTPIFSAKRPRSSRPGTAPRGRGSRRSSAAWPRCKQASDAHLARPRRRSARRRPARAAPARRHRAQRDRAARRAGDPRRRRPHAVRHREARSEAHPRHLHRRPADRLRTPRSSRVRSTFPPSSARAPRCSN